MLVFNVSTSVDTRYSTLCRNNSVDKKYYTVKCLIEPKASGGSVVEAHSGDRVTMSMT